jgi:hypothetical protein
VPVGRSGGKAQDFGGLVTGQPREIAHLDQAGLQRVGMGEPGQGRVQGEQVLVRLGYGDEVRVHHLPLAAAAVLGPRLAAGALDEDAAHGFGRRGEEVAAAVPVTGLVPVHQPYIGLVDQGRGLEGLAGPFLSEPLGRKLAEFVINQRQELVGGARIALLDGREDVGDFAHDP